MFDVVFYETRNGKCLVKEFLNLSDAKLRAKLVGILEILGEKCNLLREAYSKFIDDGIFEVRGKVGNDISRILFFFYYDGQIVLTNGFVKKTQKIPTKELKLAKKYRKDFIERQGEEL
ncbi:type II toxin-antitoxin system RelE/ParE family toxin [Acidaminobacter sp. JC074]|uniref:type II toxin-antitoxin system RelE/ParE family toxin n=1 Tax=Acidaminobacter sp. JC074 TaxID=2530199 RepID=UPI001F0FEEA5|nr:type II toxin-antitoxin system RelE/ParE family toxin [Acidaminobacter sp. JC074]MCH4891143.1 type II toxin-antitoxin system RelE/ParE family toxin [Acidaminobacter sp. JC074]